MSNAILKGGDSGTGSMTIQAPNTNGSPVVTLPDASGVVQISGNMPAFSAYQSSAQTALSINTWTKIQFQTEEFDTNNNFDSTTNYRFTPAVAGYYQFTGTLAMSLATSSGWLSFYKNGSAFKYGAQISTVSGGAFAATALIYCNGSTDYVELYGYIGVTQSPATGSANTYFQASMVRSA